MAEILDVVKIIKNGTFAITKITFRNLIKIAVKVAFLAISAILLEVFLIFY